MKKLLRIHQSSGMHWVGNGFPVRSVFDYNGLGRELSPFNRFYASLTCSRKSWGAPIPEKSPNSDLTVKRRTHIVRKMLEEHKPSLPLLRCLVLRSMACAAIVAWFVPVCGAQDAPRSTSVPAEAALKAGMAAPEFKVEKFPKGDPFSAFEKGRIYVIEFWATWCGPCVMAMPHLSELQRQYAAKQVTICGVNVWQEQDYTPETLAKVAKFVERKGALIQYSVAYDGEAALMANRWVKAAGRNGIPCSFVVDREGRLAWIGHPNMLGAVLDETVKGTWDIAAGPERLAAGMKAFKDAEGKYKESAAAGDAAWEAAAAQYPALAGVRTAPRLGAMLSAERYTEACAVGGRMVEEALKSRHPAPSTEVLEALGTPGVLKNRAVRELLLKAAQANFQLADTAEPGPHVVLARAYFFIGRTEKGRMAAKRAVELAAPNARASTEKWLMEIEEEAKGN